MENISKADWLSLHGISSTRWSGRVESVKPFVAHLPGVKLALENLLELNIPPETMNEIHAAICYVRSFTCIIMSVLWHRILVSIDFCKKIIQASDATLDMEVLIIESLLAQLVPLRDIWTAIWNKAKLVASSLHIKEKLFKDRNLTVRKRTRFQYQNTLNKNEQSR